MGCNLCCLSFEPRRETAGDGAKRNLEHKPRIMNHAADLAADHRLIAPQQLHWQSPQKTPCIRYATFASTKEQNSTVDQHTGLLVGHLDSVKT